MKDFRATALVIILIMTFLVSLLPISSVAMAAGDITLSAEWGPPTTASTWQKFTIPLTAETFGTDAATFSQVMSGITQFRIRTEMHSGNDIGGLDDVSIGTLHSSNFNSSLEGWSAAGDGTMEWVPSGGISGGYLQISDWASGDWHWAVAPANWSGNWSNLIGSSIVFYMKTDHPSQSSVVEISSKEVKWLTVSAAPMLVPPGGTSNVTVSPNPVASQQLTVSMNSSDTGCITVPSSMAIGAGQLSGQFIATAAPGAAVGCKSVIKVSAPGYNDSLITLSVGQSPVTGSDGDGDGIPDNQDQCPNTPAGDAVGSNGCTTSGGGSTIDDGGEKQISSFGDAYVYAYDYRNWNRCNWGAYDQLRAGWHPTGGESRAYIKFDLSNIDPSKVNNATLKLYHFSTAGSDNVDIGIYRVTGHWNEGTDTYHSGITETTAPPSDISWVQQPPIDPQPIISFNPGSGFGDWVEVDITPLVKKWLTGTQNDGLVIMSVGNLTQSMPESVYSFASRERNVDLDEPKGTSKAPMLILSSGGSQDTDGDGVPDSSDQCPNTPSGDTVGSNGCTTSGDGDGDEPGFGTASVLTSGFKGNVYFLPENTSVLPDFSIMTPVGTVYTQELNIPPRSFDQGFPGITDRFEWFGISYLGGMVASSPGNYTFTLTSDDGTKLWIDGELVIDNDGIHAPITKSAEKTLSAGQHVVRVDYFQGPRYQIALQLFVKSPAGDSAPLRPESNPANVIDPNGTGGPDADNDGVPDSQDQCPNTPAGTSVGSNGCPGGTSGAASLVVESRTVIPGGTVSVPVRLENVKDVGSLNFNVSYNSSVVKVSRVDKGSLLSGISFVANPNESGIIRFGFATENWVNGTGSIGHIVFEAVGSAGSSSPLTISGVEATDSSGNIITLQTSNGLVTINSNGLLGDYNGDGLITELDALAALRMSVKLLAEDLILDMDQNGRVTAEDARRILSIAVRGS